MRTQDDDSHSESLSFSISNNSTKEVHVGEIHFCIFFKYYPMARISAFSDTSC